MKIVIVGKTRMKGGHVCIGGTVDAVNRSVRLLQPDGTNFPGNTELEVGEIWDIECCNRADIEPPHVEDVLVEKMTYSGEVGNMRAYLLPRVKPWVGPPIGLFDGRIQTTQQDRGYISKRTGVPRWSTGFWSPDRPLTKRMDGKKVIYRYFGPQGLLDVPFVGFDEPVDVIPAASLIRLSLARWWKHPEADEDFELRCYLQLSGWYL